MWNKNIQTRHKPITTTHKRKSHIRFVPPDRKFDTKNLDVATAVLIDIVRGIAGFVNPLLEEDSIHPVQIL